MHLRWFPGIENSYINNANYDQNVKMLAAIKRKLLSVWNNSAITTNCNHCGSKPPWSKAAAKQLGASNKFIISALLRAQQRRLQGRGVEAFFFSQQPKMEMIFDSPRTTSDSRPRACSWNYRRFQRLNLNWLRFLSQKWSEARSVSVSDNRFDVTRERVRGNVATNRRPCGEFDRPLREREGE